jgi:hypothetical protein
LPDSSSGKSLPQVKFFKRLRNLGELIKFKKLKILGLGSASYNLTMRVGHVIKCAVADGLPRTVPGLPAYIGGLCVALLSPDLTYNYAPDNRELSL